jgi:rhomboid protease GluP
MVIETLRLRSTLLSQKPTLFSVHVVASMVAFLCLMSLIYWNSDLATAQNLRASFQSVVVHGKLHGLIFAPWVHSDLGHLGSNLIFFTIFGFLLHNYFGKILFPVLAFLFAPLIHLLTLYYYQNEVSLVGISGVVYWMGGVWISLFIGTERRMKVSQRLLAGGAFLLVNMVPSHFEPHVSYSAHFIGLILGLLTGSVYFVLFRNQIRAQERWESKKEWVWSDLDILAEQALTEGERDSQSGNEKPSSLKISPTD